MHSLSDFFNRKTILFNTDTLNGHNTRNDNIPQSNQDETLVIKKRKMLKVDKQSVIKSYEDVIIENNWQEAPNEDFNIITNERLAKQINKNIKEIPLTRSNNHKVTNLESNDPMIDILNNSFYKKNNDHKEDSREQNNRNNLDNIKENKPKEASHHDEKPRHIQDNKRKEFVEPIIENLAEHLLHLEISNLNMQSIKELRILADEYGADLSGSTQKQHIINSIIRRAVCISNVVITCDGVLEVLEESGGFGFLRSPKMNYAQSSNDVYIPNHYIRKFNLETGHSILCTIKQPNIKKGERYYPIDKILRINGKDASDPMVLEEIKERRHFDELTPCYPEERYKLESGIASEQENLTNRMIDLMSPLGRGQRALIVAPPRTGKTVLLKNIANAISIKYPKTKLFVLLIDERPEEVTDMIRSIKGEVISSTFDESAENHIHVAEMVLEKAKRLVESGDDVVIILDSITRLARAYNTTAPSSGKILTGGIDSGALQRPKRWFGAARNIDSGGSLTIVASALIETGSRMDEVIFEEFKGTGNCEIVLDRRVSEKRIFPAFDILKSGTRKEELLIPQSELQRIWLLRKVLSSLNSNESIELLREKILATKTNEDFLHTLGNNN